MAQTFVSANSSKIYGANPVSALPYTFSCLVNIASLPATSAALVWVGSSTATQPRVRLDILSTGVATATYRDASSVITLATGATTLSTGTTYALTAVFATTSQKIYVDGVEDGSNTATPSAVTIDRMAIGFQNPSTTPGAYVDATISEVGIWKSALTAGEVAQLGARAKPSRVNPQNIVFYAPLIRNVSDRRGGLSLTTSNITVADHPRVY